METMVHEFHGFLELESQHSRIFRTVCPPQTDKLCNRNLIGQLLSFSTNPYAAKLCIAFARIVIIPIRQWRLYGR